MGLGMKKYIFGEKMLHIIYKAFIFCTVFSVLSMEIAHAATMADSIAQVIAVKGEVHVQRGGKDATLGMKDKIFVQDTVRTGKTGKVQLMFTDNAVVSLSENTIFTVSDYSDKADKAFTSHIPSGFARFVTGTIVEKNPEAFTVRTPEVTVGIRGTTFAVQRGAETSTVYTENSTKAQSVVVGKLTVPAGYMAIFGTGGKVLTAPMPMSDAQRHELVKRGTIVNASKLSTVEWTQENPLSDVNTMGGNITESLVSPPFLQGGGLGDDDLDDFNGDLDDD